MTVYWVDPYLESSGGGIHGTTSNGGGTYASPWKLSHLLSNNPSTKLATLASGDEVRFKGLPFDDFFGSSQAWTSGHTGNPSNFQHASFNKQFMYALKRNTGEKYYKAQYSSYNNFRTPASSSTWNEHFPALDSSHGVKVMPTSKSISQSTIYTENNSSSSVYFLNPQNMSGGTVGIGRHGITVTAGWVSETSQTNGMTIIHSNADRSDSSDDWRWGGSSNSHAGCINWDCRNTLILAISQYRHHYIYGGDIKLESFKGSSYMPGYGIYIYSNGDIDIGHVGTGGYTYCYHYLQGTGITDQTKHTYEFDLDRWTMGYSTQRHRAYWPTQSETDGYTNSTTRTLNAYLKHTDGQYGWQLYDQSSSNPGTFNITFKDGYHHSKYDNGHEMKNYTSNNKTLNITIGTPSSYAPTFAHSSNVEENSGYGGLGNNPHIDYSFGSLNNQTTKLLSDSTNIFAAALTNSTYRAFSPSLDLVDSSLELAQGNPLNFAYDPGDRLPHKVTVLRNNKDRRPLTLVGPESSSGPSIAQFNSPSNSNKLVWHFFNNNGGKTYSDNYALQIPDYSSNDLRLNWNVSHTTGLGTTFRITLYYIQDKALGASGNTYAYTNNYKIGPFSSPTTTSTTAVFSETITSATLIDIAPKYIWAFCEVIKATGNNTVGNVVFNQLDLTQIT